MPSADSGLRHALIDSNLIASRAARIFIGQLAEHGQIMLGVNDTILEEARRALRNRTIRRGQTRGMNKEEISRRMDTAMSNLDNWMRYYQESGLLRLWTYEDHLPQLIAERKMDLFHEQWRIKDTDPEDADVAVTVVMCRLDALITNNRHMIEDADWQDIMRELGIAKPPMLLRGEPIIDWMTNEIGVWRSPDWIIEFALSVMRSESAIHDALVEWSTNITDIFPDMSDMVTARLQNLSEDTIQSIQIEMAQKDTYPITKEYLRFKP